MNTFHKIYGKKQTSNLIMALLWENTLKMSARDCNKSFSISAESLSAVRKAIFQNTSLVAPGALAHRLQRRNACNAA